MKGKKYLQEIYELETERIEIEEEILEIRNRSNGLISKYENLISGKGVNKDLSGLVATVEQKVSELLRKEKDIIIARDKIVNSIKECSANVMAKRILILRYVRLKKFEVIGRELFISDSMMYKLHKEGLIAIEKFISAKSVE